MVTHVGSKAATFAGVDTDRYDLFANPDDIIINFWKEFNVWEDLRVFSKFLFWNWDIQDVFVLNDEDKESFILNWGKDV